MKRQYLKFIIAGLFLQSNISVVHAAGVDLGNSNNQVQNNIEQDEICRQTPRPENLEATEYWYDQAYNSCLARNRQRAEVRAYAARGRADAQEILNGTLKEPVNDCKPSGSSGGYDHAYNTCIQQYSSAKREYDRKAEAARLAKAEEDKAKADPNSEISKLNDSSATGSMAEIQKKNEEGNKLYTIAGAALAGYAAFKFTNSAQCAAQCGAAGGGCCTMAPALAAAGAAFMLLNGKANNQADEHAASATEACKTFNQLSSSQKDCSGTAPVLTTSQPPVTEWYDNEGRCKTSAPPECQTIAGTGSGPGMGKIPTNCKDASGKSVSCVAAGLDLFKKNPDGSIKVKTPNGDKTYKLSDFADKKSMMAAGLTEAQADSLMNDLYGKNSALAKAGLDAKDLSKEASSGKKFSDFTSGSGSGSGSTGLSASDSAKNANNKFGEKLNGVNRGPSSQGLSRDFNGDLIGAAGDDLFSMMKRRYILKNEQDTFIAP